METEMVATECIGAGEELTPALSPIAYSLHDSFLHSHCASCFSALHHYHQQQQRDVVYYYCSPRCESSHYPLHLSSAAHLLSLYPSSSALEASDLRVALLLLLQIKQQRRFFKSHHRICGLISNRHSLLFLSDHDLATKIRNGARAMAMAIAASRSTSTVEHDFLLEEAVLCAVITNAVEVQDTTGRSVGIAVYDTTFSWINHCCSPNACYHFLPPHHTLIGDHHPSLITPASFQPFDNSDLLTGLAGGPRIVVRSIKMIRKGEQVTVSYTDLLQPKELRQSELWSKYRFTCCCHRCVALPLTYVDKRLQEFCGSSDFVTEYIDDAIHDYLSSNDTESCCKKLEDVLLSNEIRLGPQNHLSLKAYMTLASAYSSASAMKGDEDDLKIKRFGAAYSLLLALRTHDLFLHESSLIVSVSNFWIGAGESLINLAACVVSSSTWDGCGCRLIDIFEGNYEVLEVLKDQVFKCMRDIIRAGKVWKFLVAGNGYLEVVKDPMDLTWLVAENASVSDDRDCQQVFGLGAHCLLYGGILSVLSGGHNSHLSCYVRQLLYQLSITNYDGRG